ncbi:hypothetical protein PybrP1_010894, partial [[Pythium] brassicae (nom. inval.)]
MGDSNSPASSPVLTYELVNVNELPTIDIMRSIKSAFCNARSIQRFNSLMRRSARVTKALYIASLPCDVALFFVSETMGRWFALVMFAAQAPLLLFAFASLRSDMLKCLLQTYEFWFLSLMNVSMCAVYCAYFGDLRAAAILVYGLGVQLNICVDAALYSRRIAVTLSLYFLYHLVPLVATVLRITPGTRSSTLLAYKERAVMSEDFLTNALSTIVFLMARPAYRNFLVVFVGCYNRKLLRELVFSFDFCFFSTHLTIVHVCVCDVFSWDGRCFFVLFNWLAMHWVLTLGALTPKLRRSLGLRVHYVIPVVVFFVAAICRVSLDMVVLTPTRPFQDRLLFSFRVFSHHVEFRIGPFVLNRAWTLLLLWSRDAAIAAIKRSMERMRLEKRENEQLSEATFSLLDEVYRQLLGTTDSNELSDWSSSWDACLAIRDAQLHSQLEDARVLSEILPDQSAREEALMLLQFEMEQSGATSALVSVAFEKLMMWCGSDEDVSVPVWFIPGYE